MTTYNGYINRSTLVADNISKLVEHKHISKYNYREKLMLSSMPLPGAHELPLGSSCAPAITN